MWQWKATFRHPAGDVVHMFHVVPNVAEAADGTPADPGLAALADVPVAVPRNDSAQDAANVRLTAYDIITCLECGQEVFAGRTLLPASTPFPQLLRLPAGTSNSSHFHSQSMTQSFYKR